MPPARALLFIAVLLFGFGTLSEAFVATRMRKKAPAPLVTMYLFSAQGWPGMCGWSTSPTYCSASTVDSNPFDTNCWQNHSSHGTCTYGAGGTCGGWVGPTGGQKAGGCP